jgi:hypothetical protein
MKKPPSDVKPVLIVTLKLITTSEKENLLQKIFLADQSGLKYSWWIAFSLRIFTIFLSQKIYNDRGNRTGKRGQIRPLFPVHHNFKPRKANVSQSKWSYAELDDFIHDKAVMNNSLAVRVDAEEWSQSIPDCGQKNKYNCPNQGLIICCGRCGCKLYADLVGGRNVTMRNLLLRQDGRNRGLIVTALNTLDFKFKTQKQNTKGTRHKEIKAKVAALLLLSRVLPIHLDSLCPLAASSKGTKTKIRAEK